MLIIFTHYMHKGLIYLLFCLSLLYYRTAYAQISADAQKQYQQALKLRASKKNAEAEKLMLEVINKAPGYPDAYSTLGYWYFSERSYAKANEIFVRASQNCANGHVAFAKPLAKTLLYSYQPTQALQLLIAHAPAEKTPEWELLRQQATFMQQALNNQWPDTPINLGIRINTRYPEFHPQIAADTQTLYFTRRVHNEDEDFFFAQIDTCGGWLTDRNMGSPPNTSKQEAAQILSADGHYLFFTRCENRSENGWGKGGCDLYMAYSDDSAWSIPQSFGATINTPAYEGMPCLSADNRELYFVSDRADGFGGLDIWISRFEDGLWQKPENAGPNINTAGDDIAPFLHIDNQTLYFASDGHPGMGSSDLFVSRKSNNGTWGRPRNLGYPINTVANENSLSVTVDGTKIYFASDRDSTIGNTDIYEMGLPVALQPIKVATVKGFVYDSLSKIDLNYARIYIMTPNSAEPAYQFSSNRGDASFMMTLPVGKVYTYSADRVGYLEMTDTIDLTEADLKKPIIHNIALLPQDYQAPIHDSLVLTVEFPINGTKLSDSNKLDIQKAIEPWMGEKGYTVLINGYTDNTGTPLLNEELSYMRAGLVAEEVQNYGIDEMNIRSQGWGEANPKASNDTEIGRNINRRVEIIIRR